MWRGVALGDRLVPIPLKLECADPKECMTVPLVDARHTRFPLEPVTRIQDNSSLENKTHVDRGSISLSYYLGGGVPSKSGLNPRKKEFNMPQSKSTSSTMWGSH